MSTRTRKTEARPPPPPQVQQQLNLSAQPQPRNRWMVITILISIVIGIICLVLLFMYLNERKKNIQQSERFDQERLRLRTASSSAATSSSTGGANSIVTKSVFELDRNKILVSTEKDYIPRKDLQSMFVELDIQPSSEGGIISMGGIRDGWRLMIDSDRHVVFQCFDSSESDSERHSIEPSKKETQRKYEEEQGFKQHRIPSKRSPGGNWKLVSVEVEPVNVRALYSIHYDAVSSSTSSIDTSSPDKSKLELAKTDEIATTTDNTERGVYSGGVVTLFRNHQIIARTKVPVTLPTDLFGPLVVGGNLIYHPKRTDYIEEDKVVASSAEDDLETTSNKRDKKKKVSSSSTVVKRKKNKVSWLKESGDTLVSTIHAKLYSFRMILRHHKSIGEMSSTIALNDLSNPSSVVFKDVDGRELVRRDPNDFCFPVETWIPIVEDDSDKEHLPNEIERNDNDREVAKDDEEEMEQLVTLRSNSVAMKKKSQVSDSNVQSTKSEDHPEKPTDNRKIKKKNTNYSNKTNLSNSRKTQTESSAMKRDGPEPMSIDN